MPVAEWFADLLKRELQGRVDPSDSQIAQLHEHYELLERWNRKINLTSIPSGPEAVIRHYCESLLFAVNIPFTDKANIADLGSGAGFPGVPMAILRPEWAVALIESHQRKAVFLREAARNLINVRVLASRGEDVAETFDWLVSRAVDPKDVLANVPRLALQVGLMLGEDDWNALKTTSRIAWAEPIRLPWGDRRMCVYGVSRDVPRDVRTNVPRGTSM
jgi:16S rRNA (guanine(527)-N(7))-methyltransferase RsmG